MKAKVRVLKEITIDRITLALHVRYGEEDIPLDFPLRRGDLWKATVEIDTGKIVGWPTDPKWQDCTLEMKVCDEGNYTLSDDHGNIVAELINEYVPHGIVPGEYGDYVCLKIKNGMITNWPRNPDVSAFFGGEHE